MALEFQTLPVAFTQGLDTKTQDKLIVPGKWTQLENLYLSKNGTPSRRDGIAALVATANGNGLAQYNDELLAVAGPVVSSISSTAAAAIVVPGSVGNVGISKTELRRSVGMQDTPDCAYGAGFVCYAWREKSASNVATGVSMTLVDEASGAHVIPITSMRTSATVFGVRVVFVGTCFQIFYIDGSSLFCRVVNVSAPSVLAAENTLIFSVSLAQLAFDACLFAGQAMVTYAWADGVTSVRSIQVSLLGTTVTNGPTNVVAQADVTVASLTGLCCEAFSTDTTAGIYLTHTAGGAVAAGLVEALIDSAWNVTVPATNLAAGGVTVSAVHVTAVRDGVNMRVFWDEVSEWSTNAIVPIQAVILDVAGNYVFGPVTVQRSAAFGAGVTARGPQGPWIHGKAFSSGGRIYLPVYVASVYSNLSAASANPRTANAQNAFFVLDTGPSGVTIGAAVVVAKALYGSYGVASFNATRPSIGTPCSSPFAGATFVTVSGELTQLVLSNGINVSPTGLVRLSMTPNATVPPIRAQLGESTYVAGGSLAAYDGAGIAETGFPLFPDGVAVTVNGAGGAMTAGVHQLVVIYEWVDNAGQRHQSAPCLPITITTVANDSLTVRVPSMLLSQKTGIAIVAYMTQAAGLEFNRVLLNGGVYAPVLNNPAATTTALSIFDSDATIAGNELLYTQPNDGGTALANVAPGPTSSLTVAHQRLWFDRADQNGFGYSQQYVNNVGLHFSPLLGAQLPNDAGPRRGFSPLDEKVVVFCARRIFVVYGTGPNQAGGFNNYSDPQEVPSDVGCSVASSILKMPMGIVFKATKGWYLLGRDLSVSYIGSGVDRYDADEPTSAVLMGDRQECRFTLASGTVLVWSYEDSQWSTFQSVEYVPLDAVWWPATSRYTHISLTQGLNQDTPGIYADSPGVIAPNLPTWTAQTSWLHLSPLEGFQRVRRMYLTATPNNPNAVATTVAITVIFDDSGTAPGAYTATAHPSTLLPGLSLTVDIRHRLRRQKCKSVRFSFTEASESGAVTTQCLTGIQAIALEIGVKNGVNRLPAAQTLA